MLHGLKVLERRGFDGVGIASMNDDSTNLIVSKLVVADDRNKNNQKGDPMVRLVDRHYKNCGSGATTTTTAIAHTRWATIGDKDNPHNVHPHLDASGRIAVVHNGTLTNAGELKRSMVLAANPVADNNHILEGQTDSEIMAKLIGEYYDRSKHKNLVEAVRLATERWDGTWGLVVMCADRPEELVVTCHGSSLYVGIGDDNIYVASDLEALRPYTQTYITLKDGEVARLDATGKTLDLSRKESTKDNEDEKSFLEDVKATPAPFDHWTLKEIMDQPEAVARSLGFGSRLTMNSVYLGGLDQQIEALKQVQHIAIGGCGSSLNAAKFGERIMKALVSVPGRIISLDTVEADVTDLAHSGRSSDGMPASSSLIAVTQSGESAETKHLVDEANFEGITTLGCVNAVGSPVARATKMGVYCNAGPENGVTSTKTFTSQVTCLALIALWFRELQDQIANNTGKKALGRAVEIENLKEALARLPISLGMALKTRDRCKEVAERLKDKEHCFVLGKGYGEAIALEGALKIKELANLHAEGYSGGALKHGPFALIENDLTGKFGATPIVMLILDDQHAHHMRTAAEEVKARGADLIIVTDKAELAEDLDDHPLVIPTNGPLTGLGALISLQLIAYELALLR